MLEAQTSLTKVDVEGNRICDEGGQGIAQYDESLAAYSNTHGSLYAPLIRSLAVNTILRELNLTRTEVSVKTAFVASKFLRNHPSMKVRSPVVYFDDNKRCDTSVAPAQRQSTWR